MPTSTRNDAHDREILDQFTQQAEHFADLAAHSQERALAQIVRVAGVAAHPAQGSLWWATRGGGAFEGRVVGGRVVAETPVHVGAGEDTVAGSRLGVVPEDWARELVAPLKEVTPALPWPIHPALMVARGDLDLAVQTGGQIWDFAATSLIVQEAGGSYSGIDGRPRPGPGASVYARSDALRRAALDLVGDSAARATS